MRKIPLGNLNSNNPIKTSVKKYHASVARQSSRERNRLLACKSFAFIHANVHKTNIQDIPSRYWGETQYRNRNSIPDL